MLVTAEGLRKRGHRIYFSGRRRSYFLQRCAQAGFPILPLSIKGDFGPLNILRLASFYKRHHIDVVVANFNKDVRLAGIARKLTRNPLLVARNGLPILQNNWRYRLTYRFLVDGIITNTRAIKNRYLTYGWLPEDFIKVIHNGIDVQQPVEFDKAEILRRYDLPANTKFVGIFGRLVKQKQHHFFLEAAAQIRKASPRVHFLIVGEGPLRPVLMKKVQELNLNECVHFLGLQTEVMPLYRICNVVLLTSEDEGLPNVVMEAMLASRPVVAFRVGGIEELIPDGTVGRTVAPNDIASLVKETVHFLQNEGLSRKTGERARQRIQEKFSIEKMIREVEEHLQSLLSRRK
ncbi:MAG: glycosyltransferase [Calditrichia bacterium]